MRTSSTAATEPADDSYRIILSPRLPVHVNDRRRSPPCLLVRFGGGLVVNQLCVGVVQGALPALVYPLVKRRLLLEGYQANSAQALLAVAVTCKLGFSVLMDRLPLTRWLRQRRVPFIHAGWFLVLLFTVMLARMHATTPTKADAIGSSDGQLAELGSKSVLLLVGVALGSVLADAGCEALMVDTTRRRSNLAESDGASIRADQAAHKAMYVARFTADVLGALLVGGGLNDAAFGGSFPFALSVSALFEVLVAVALVAILATMWGVKEDVKHSVSVATIAARSATEKSGLPTSTPSHHATAAVATVTASTATPSVVELSGLMHVVRSHVMWQLALFGFLQKLFLDLQAAPRLAIHASWLHTDPLCISVALAATSGAYALASLLSHRVLLTAESNWRSITLAAVVIGSGLSLAAGILTTMGIVRDKYLVLIVEQLVVFCDAIAMMVRMLAVVQIAEPGRESSTYAVVTAFYSLAEPVSAATSNYLGAAFDVFDADIASDSERVRWHVVGLLITLGALRVVGNASILSLLPRDQRAAHELKERWHVGDDEDDDNGTHLTAVAVAVAAVTVVVSIAALTVNVLAISASTACLPFAGGAGC